MLNSSYYERKYCTLDRHAILQASRTGDFEFLEWFKNSGYEFKYSEWAINLACYYGNVQVLEWFKNSDYEFKYDRNAIYYACMNGNFQVLEWLKNYCNNKKIIKISKSIYIKTIKFKTKNNYIKGYNKN
jgi:hypothetical protein